MRELWPPRMGPLLPGDVHWQMVSWPVGVRCVGVSGKVLST